MSEPAFNAAEHAKLAAIDSATIRFFDGGASLGEASLADPLTPSGWRARCEAG